MTAFQYAEVWYEVENNDAKLKWKSINHLKPQLAAWPKI